MSVQLALERKRIANVFPDAVLISPGFAVDR
jgi:hypothetical protein